MDGVNSKRTLPILGCPPSHTFPMRSSMLWGCYFLPAGLNGWGYTPTHGRRTIVNYASTDASVRTFKYPNGDFAPMVATRIDPLWFGEWGRF